MPDDVARRASGATPGRSTPPPAAGVERRLRARRAPLAHLALLGATFLWGTNFVAASIALRALTPVQLAGYRWVPALVLMGWIALYVERPHLPRRATEWGRQLACAAFGASGYSLFLYSALLHLNATQAAIFGALNPSVILLASAVFLRTVIRPGQVIGVALAFAGAVVAFGGTGELSMSVPAGEQLAGLGFMAAAIVSWSVFTIVGSRLATPPITSTWLQAVLSVLGIGVVLGARGELKLPVLEPVESLAYVYIALGPTTAAFLLWLYGVRTLGAATAGPYTNLTPVFTAVIGLGLGIALTASEIIGGTIIIAGMVIATLPWATARSRAPGQRALLARRR